MLKTPSWSAWISAGAGAGGQVGALVANADCVVVECVSNMMLSRNTQFVVVYV